MERVALFVKPPTHNSAVELPPPSWSAHLRKLDDPVRRSMLLHALCTGSGRNAACRYAGISHQQFKEYLSLDLDFLDQVESAEQARAVHSVQRILDIGEGAAVGDWRALAWFLERKFPDEWGRRDRLAVTGKDGGPLQVQDLSETFDLTRLSDHEYGVLKALVAKIDERMIQAHNAPQSVEVPNSVVIPTHGITGGNGNGNGTGGHA